MKTFLVDGQWLVKKNYFKRMDYNANGVKCGASFGFLESLKSVFNKILPDRVIVMWDGYNSGKLRYEIHKPYKANRNKSWNKEANSLKTDGTESEEEKEIYEILNQKLVIKNFLEEFSIRQMEVELIEADDLIAYYILTSKIPNEEIIIYSRDKDFHQLVDRRVSVLSPDNLELITIQNFKKVFGFTHENALLFKCFNGDSGDNIDGVKGITPNGLLEHFPAMANEKYMFSRLVEECYDKKRDKKLKFFDKVIESRNVLYRNAKLMDLRRPFINEEVKEEMQNIIYGSLSDDRKINNAMSLFIKNGFTKFVENKYLDLFFAPFYRIMNKEKEFANNLKS